MFFPGIPNIRIRIVEQSTNSSPVMGTAKKISRNAERSHDNEKNCTDPGNSVKYMFYFYFYYIILEPAIFNNYDFIMNIPQRNRVTSKQENLPRN